MELTVNIPEKYVIDRSPDELRLLLKLNTAIDIVNKEFCHAESS